MTRSSSKMVQIWTPVAKTIKKNTNSTQNKSETHRAKQYEVMLFLSTDCELRHARKTFIVLAPEFIKRVIHHCEGERTYVPRYLCSAVPMFRGTYVPRYLCSPNLCSPVPMFPEPMFPSTYVPRFAVNDSSTPPFCRCNLI